MARNCMELLQAQFGKKKFLCIGLDSDKELLPPVRWQTGQMEREHQLIFNKEIVDATSDLAAAFKLNPAFYLSDGFNGMWVLAETIEYLHQMHPTIPVILDGKFGDIGNSTKHYVIFAFNNLDADAVTVNPYLGRQDALEPFLEQKDRGIFVLCRTSNKGSRIFQNPIPQYRNSLFASVAIAVRDFWNANGNCGLVMSALDIGALQYVRRIIPDLPILVTGIGKQGGNTQEAVLAARDSQNQGFLINASRSIIFVSRGSDFAKAARQEAERLSKAIRRVLKTQK